MRVTAFLFCLFLFFGSAQGQTFLTRSGQVSFRSEAAEELIEAKNNDVAAQLFINEGRGQVIIPIKSFRFKNALLEEHFNENYLESDRYPKATYKFSVTNIAHVDFAKTGKYNVNTTGVIKIKNKEKQVAIPGFITVKDNHQILLEANFTLLLADYEIEIPRLVEKKLAKAIQINVHTLLSKQ
ncbi:YceI family protein [Sphingobacterium sp. LRF_L2]|uniref:YceI family protein n=1 Tax=Sphingobacterium sp. LRF_L2 TaxID=3369421 RepID=UPI003F609EAC